MTFVILVLVVHFPEDIGDMVLGANDPNISLTLWIASLALIGIVLFHIWATVYTLRHQLKCQMHATAIVEPLMQFFFGRLRSRQHYTRSDISPYHRVNGYPPESGQYKELLDGRFADWALTIGGLVERPLRLSLADLQALPKQEQIVKHNCIQGWSAVAEWAAYG